MNKLYLYFGLSILPALSQSVLADDVISELQSSHISRYEFGLFKLQLQARTWAASYNEQPGLDVSVSINKKGNINFHMLSSYAFARARSKLEIQSTCNKIRHYFSVSVLGNLGDPEDKNIYGNNMYYLTWGSYFSNSTTPKAEIEMIGKSISKNSAIHIFTGNPLLEECVYSSDEKYE